MSEEMRFSSLPKKHSLSLIDKLIPSCGISECASSPLTYMSSRFVRYGLYFWNSPLLSHNTTQRKRYVTCDVEFSRTSGINRKKGERLSNKENSKQKHQSKHCQEFDGSRFLMEREDLILYIKDLYSNITIRRIALYELDESDLQLVYHLFFSHRNESYLYENLSSSLLTTEYSSTDPRAFIPISWDLFIGIIKKQKALKEQTSVQGNIRETRSNKKNVKNFDDIFHVYGIFIKNKILKTNENRKIFLNSENLALLFLSEYFRQIHSMLRTKMKYETNSVQELQTTDNSNDEIGKNFTDNNHDGHNKNNRLEEREDIGYGKSPLYTIVMSTIDAIAENRDKIIDEMLSFIHTDTLLIQEQGRMGRDDVFDGFVDENSNDNLLDSEYHENVNDTSLKYRIREMQRKVYNPLIRDFCIRRKVVLKIQRCLFVSSQEARSCQKLREVYSTLPTFQLAALYVVTRELKSLILADYFLKMCLSTSNYRSIRDSYNNKEGLNHGNIFDSRKDLLNMSCVHKCWFAANLSEILQREQFGWIKDVHDVEKEEVFLWLHASQLLSSMTC